MTRVRTTPLHDARGNSHDRARRRAWLIKVHGFVFTYPRNRRKVTLWVLCHHCHRSMRADKHAWEVDRYPVCGHDGGRYTRDNIVIACIRCNRTRCNNWRCK